MTQPTQTTTGAAPEPTRPGARIHTARAELILALPSEHPLREVPLKPDPLTPFAAAVADVRADLGEHAEIALDLLPLTSARARHYRRRAAQAASRGGSARPTLSDALGRAVNQSIAASRGLGAITPPAPPRPAPSGRAASAAAAGKYAADTPLFAVQILVRTRSEIPARAQAHLKRILAAFSGYDGANYLRAAGWHLGPFHLGSDSFLLRRSFDERMDSGLFRPRRESVLTGAELAGLLKPPTKHCAARNVERSGGLVPAAPRELPTYHLGARDLLPLGYVTTPAGTDKLAAAYLSDTLFQLILGKAGFGKTELMLVQAIALAHAGHGLWFLDPHRDAAQRARPYLAHAHLARRIWDVDLTVRSPDAMICSWNPLSMQGRGQEDIPDVVGAITAGFASALNWGDTSNRALTILTKSCEALAELSFRMVRAGRPDLQPTIFQIGTLLSDEDWRAAVISSLSKHTARFWRSTFEKYPADATPVVTNALDRIATSLSARAFLGGSQSTYDVRRAMDSGKVVWVCPAGTGPTDRLVSCLMMFDLLRAGLSRRDIPPDQRRPYYAFVDELTAIDGASKGTLAAIVEQLRKFRVRLFAATQMASRLTASTRDALFQNQSVLSTSASEAEAARLAARQWGTQVDPETIMALPRYQHVMSVMLHDQPTSPFKVRGAEVTQLFEPWHNPGGLARLEAAVNTNLDRRPMREILADQASLDERIAEFLAGAALRRRGGSASPTATASRASGAPGSELAPADGADLAPVIALRPDGGSARHAAQDAAPGSDLD